MSDIKTSIKDGTGKGYETKVDSRNRIVTNSTTLTTSLDATVEGNGYNINTGLITISTDNSTLLYFKNTEDSDFVVENIIITEGNGITHSDDPNVTIIKNPTGGDLISDASPVAMNVNRNFGSSKTLSASTVAYKGKSGGTVTGGTDVAILGVNPGTRNFYPLELVIPKGNAMAIKLDANITLGSATYYAVLTGYLKADS